MSDGTTTGSGIVIADFEGAVSTDLEGRLSIRRGTFASAVAASNNTALGSASYSSHFYVRLEMVASGTWQALFSVDGISWIDPMADLAGGISAPTHYGVFVTRWGGGANEANAAFEYLRVYDLA